MSYKISEYYKGIAEKIIEARPELQFIKDNDIRVGYLISDQKKKGNKKITFADCEKVKDKHKTYIPYDFIITVYTNNIGHLSEEQKQVLIWHELLHIGNDGGTNPHDLEDFYLLTKQFGVDWAEQGKVLKVGDFFG